jgi:glycine C-acetyltransferase
MKKAGFDIIDGDSAIVPVMLYDAKLSQNMADELLKKRHICNRFLSCGP